MPSERSLESVSDLGFNVRPKYRGHTETGPRFAVSSERPEERRIEPATLELNSSAQKYDSDAPKFRRKK